MNTPFIVRRDLADLSESLRRTRVGDEAVEIIVDRRAAERRRTFTTVTPERRRRERRARADIEAELRANGWAIVGTIPVGLSVAHAGSSDAPAPLARNPRRHRCRVCGSVSVQRDARRGWTEHAVSLWRRPYYCLACGARFFDRPLPTPRRQPSTRRWPRLAMVGCLVIASVGGGIMLWEPADSWWTLGFNLLVLGGLGLLLSAIAAWITREGP